MGFKKSTFNVNFLLRKHKLLRNGEAPICMHIRVNNRAVDISIKRSVSPEHWNQARESCISSGKVETVKLLTLATINKTSTLYSFDDGMIFHSDRGTQYASKATRNSLKSYNIVQSMS